MFVSFLRPRRVKNVVWAYLTMKWNWKWNYQILQSPSRPPNCVDSVQSKFKFKIRITSLPCQNSNPQLTKLHYMKQIAYQWVIMFPFIVSTLMNLESVRLTSLVGCPCECWKILKWCSWCAHRGSNLDRQITLNQLSQPPVETLFLGSARSPLEWLCQKKKIYVNKPGSEWRYFF